MSKLSKAQRRMLRESVNEPVRMADLPLSRLPVARQLEQQGLVEIVLGRVTPTERGATVQRDLHDAKEHKHACELCAKTWSTRAGAIRCAQEHVPEAKPPRAKRKRKRKHACLSCKTEYTNKADAKRCLDSHW